jgi:hypothetical protein
MPNSIQEKIFDFTKPVEKALEKTSRYNYKKLLFLSISFSVFTSLGISLTSHIYEHFAKEKQQAKEQKMHVAELQKKHFELFFQQQAILQQKKEKLKEQQNQEVMSFEKKQIQAITPQEFQDFQNYLSQNLNIYDNQVEFVQNAIVNAYQEYFEEKKNNAQLSVTNIKRAQELGILLNQHKQNLINNYEIIKKIKDQISNNIETVNEKDIQTFIDYYNLYKMKSVIRSEKIDNKIQLLLYRDNSNNGRYINLNSEYNLKNNIYQQFDIMNQQMNHFFTQKELKKNTKNKLN